MPVATFSCGSTVDITRESVRAFVDHDTAEWGPLAGSWTILVEIGPVGGPYAPADLVQSAATPCSPAEPNPIGAGGTNNTFAHIVGLTPATSYEIRWTLSDENDVLQNQIVCPYTTPGFPTYVCLANNVEETSATFGYGGVSGLTDQAAPCAQDQVTWSWGTTPGGPYPNTIGPVNATGSPSTNVTGLTPGTTYYYVANMVDGNGNPYPVQPAECSVTTDSPPAPTVTTGPTTAITQTGATLGGSGTNAPVGSTIQACYGTTAGGPYATCGPVPFAATGLTPNTAYFYVAQMLDDTNAVIATGAEVTFTTLAQTPEPPMSDCPAPLIGIPTAAGDGDSQPGRDVEQIVLCDKDANGDIVGTAIAVWEYDDVTGAPIGAPTFVDPVTGDPYVPQGTLSPCEQCQAMDARTFFFTSSVTAPTDFPGRSFSGQFPIAIGKSVSAISISGTNFPVALTWNILDTDGTQFATALQNALRQRVRGSTVTVTPPVVDPCATAPQLFTVNIGCIDQAQAPDSVDLIYDSGSDLIKNPAFLDAAGNPVVPPGGLAFTTRIDNGGTIGCTDVASEGWQTNDPFGQFESWGAGFLGTTPTPRGTGIQEINANGRNTIWQRITVLAAGVFTVRAFVGGRQVSEQWNLRLSTGNTGAGGPGDVVNITQTAPPVGDTASPQPWTRIEQAGISLAPGTYTLSMTGPNTNSIGGLFTDLQLFTTAEGTIFSLDADDTCINTRDVTTNTVTCELWMPQTNGNCEIVAWQSLDDGELMTNDAFWAQVPAPVGCYVAPEGEPPEVTFGNLIHTYAICAAGVTLQRTIITDNSGAAISESFTDSNGVAVGPPTSYTIGPCTAGAPDVEEILVCADGVTAIRRVTFVGGGQASEVFVGADGATLTPTSWSPGPCLSDDTEFTESVVLACINGVTVKQVTVKQFTNGTFIGEQVAFFDSTGSPVVGAATLGPCPPAVTPENNTEALILCDDTGGPTPTRFIRRIVYDASGNPVQVSNTTLDGTTTYVPTGSVSSCPEDPGALELDLIETQWCVGDAQATRYDVVDNTTGAVVTTTWRRNDGTVFAPTAPELDEATAGACTDCCPVTLGSGCATGDRTWTSVRNSDGTVTLVNDVTGTTVLPADVIACPSENEGEYVTESVVLGCVNGAPAKQVTVKLWNGHSFISEQVGVFNGAGAPVAGLFITGPCAAATADVVTNYQTTVVDVTGGAPQTFNPAPGMVSWTARNRNATTATIRVNGGAVLPLDTAESIGASLTGHDLNDTLQDTIIVNPGDGAVRVTITRRL